MGQGAKRIDIISDTHGHLSKELLAQLAGAELIIHAGDLTSESDYMELMQIAPVKAVLGNNDFYRDYGPDVDRVNTFEYEGISFAVAHYREDLPLGEVDFAVCGHTHRPKMARVGGTIVVNPGSPTFPRDPRGATMARATVENGSVISLDIISL